MSRLPEKLITKNLFDISLNFRFLQIFLTIKKSNKRKFSIFNGIDLSDL